MGRTIEKLSHKILSAPAVFDKRFVVECCEKFHIHYRNLRIILTTQDFITFIKGAIQAHERWVNRGCPENPSTHIELCRKSVAQSAVDEGIKVNLNENLYNNYEGKIFAEGAGIKDPEYIHLKIRDLRIELSLEEFKELTSAVNEANTRLENRCASPVL